MKHQNKIIISGCVLIIAALVLGIFAYLVYQNNKKLDAEKDIVKAGNKSEKNHVFMWPSTDAKYITAMPLDLNQIESVSKYRSCAGHDRSGYSFEQTMETDRSMKHYLYPASDFQGTIDEIELFAPYDGVINSIQLVDDSDSSITKIKYLKLKEDGTYTESNYTRPAEARLKMGNGIDISNDLDKNVVFCFGHVQFVKNFKPGDAVAAGELIGYASVAEKFNDFDIDLVAKEYYQAEDGQYIEVLGSIFDHMTESVLAEFEKFGLTPEKTKFSKEYRDQNPCLYNSEFKNNSPLAEGRNNDSWLLLKGRLISENN